MSAFQARNRATVRLLNGWWLLEVPSPFTSTGSVVQGEYRTAAMAEAQRDAWNARADLEMEEWI